jgi:hypothetical protein
MPLTSADLAELTALLGSDGVLASEAARFTYEADALTLERWFSRPISRRVCLLRQLFTKICVLP